MKQLLIIVFAFIAGSSFAQEFNISKVELDAGKVNVYYNLLDTIKSRVYTISLYSSADNFISPLSKITGDAGLEIKPGGNRRITWNIVEEFGRDFEGDVALEVRGRIYVPFIRLDGLQKSFKRGVAHELTWTGGTQQNILNFDLYKGDHKITSFPNIANVGHYTMVLPRSVKSGKDYRFRIVDSRNKDQVVYTGQFHVKPKFPLFLKIAPVALVGAAIYLLAPGSDKDRSIKEPPLADNILE